MWKDEWIGKKFGDLTIIADGGYDLRYGQKVQMVVCKCDCGTDKRLLLTAVFQGKVRSCGCFRRNRMTKHGLRFHPLYLKWVGMKRRCYYPKDEHYYCYGGRGIIVCNEWRNDFLAFYNWGINAPNYGIKDELDRIDNDGNYEPSNCRWATRTEQVCNTSRNVFVWFNGNRMTLSQLYVNANVPKSRRGTVRRRIVEYGWTLTEAISEFLNTKPHEITKDVV